MNQYVCMTESLSFPLSSTSKGINPSATDAGVCILSTGPTSGMNTAGRIGSGGAGFLFLTKTFIFLDLTRACLCPDRICQSQKPELNHLPSSVGT